MSEQRRDPAERDEHGRGPQAQPTGEIEHTNGDDEQPAPPDPTAGQPGGKATTEGLIEHTGRQDEGDEGDEGEGGGK